MYSAAFNRFIFKNKILVFIFLLPFPSQSALLGMSISITRVFSFSAAHRLYDKLISEEENQRIFGKCCNIHGHNYKCIIIYFLNVVKVTVTGSINENGMIINQTLLDKIVNDSVIRLLDHKFIDEDLDFFKNSTRYISSN